MKRYRAVLLLALLLALPVSAACGENREPEGTADTESRETGEKDEDSRTEEASGEVPETYTFVDVEGTTYEAVLEEELASCRWDYSRLTREGEFLYYKIQREIPFPGWVWMCPAIRGRLTGSR